MSEEQNPAGEIKAEEPVEETKVESTEDLKPQTTNEFIKEVRLKQIKRIKGLGIDQMYYDRWLKANDEDKLRDGLEEENKKVEKNKEGKVIKDDRDFKAIALLTAKIDKIEKIKQNKLQTEENIVDIKFYVEMLDSLTDEEKAVFDKIENI